MRAAAYLVLLLGLAAGAAEAQVAAGASPAAGAAAVAPAGYVRGTVQFQDGRPAAALAVELYRVGSGPVDDTITGPGGRFQFRLLGPGGNYEVYVITGTGAIVRAAPEGGSNDVVVVLRAPKGTAPAGQDLPPSPKARKALAQAEQALNALDFAQAEKLLDQAIQASPGWGRPYFAMGQIALQQRNRAAARADFNRALAADPKNGATLTALGQLMLENGDGERAAGYLQQALALPPVAWTTFQEMARLDLERRDFAAAATMVSRAQGCPGAPPELALLAAAAAEGLGQTRTAVAAYRAYLAAGANNAAAAETATERIAALEHPAPAAAPPPLGKSPLPAGPPLAAVPVSLPGAKAAPHAPGAPSQPEVASFHATVREVRVPVTVVNAHHRGVGNLRAPAFRVLEDGVPQTLTSFVYAEAPLSAGLLLDNSGSMGMARAGVNVAAMDFVVHTRPGDEVFVANFNDHFQLASPFSHQVAQLRHALPAPTGGGTALYDAILAGVDYLSRGATREKQVLVVVTDGEDTSSHHTLEQVLARLRQADAPLIYCIGMGPAAVDGPDSHRILTALAEATGGQARFPMDANSLDDDLQAWSHDLRAQYSLTYLSHSQGAEYRTIQVEVTDPKHPGLLAITRGGYQPDPR